LFTTNRESSLIGINILNLMSLHQLESLHSVLGNAASLSNGFSFLIVPFELGHFTEHDGKNEPHRLL